jgi:hypothetical protein
MVDPSRITHIKRIHQDNDPNRDVWVDVERIDKVTVIVAGRQRRTYEFDWDTFESEQTADQDKKTISDPSDETSTIDIPIRNKIRLKFPRAVYNHIFLNDATNASRETHSRRIYHHEINAAYLSDGEPPGDPQMYRDSLGQQDKDQFIDVEVLDNYWTKGDDPRDHYQQFQRLQDGRAKDPKTVRGQRHKWDGTTNDPLMEDPLVEGDVEGGSPGFILRSNPQDGPIIDPPWRLDPLQNIVNVHWAAGAAFVMGSNGQTCDSLYLEVKKKTFTQEDEGGQDFEAGNINGSSYHFVEPDDSDPDHIIEGGPVFLLCGDKYPNDSGFTERVGMIRASSDGKSWSTVYRIENLADDENINSISYIMGLVWDEDARSFYAAGHLSNQFNAPSLSDPHIEALETWEEIDILLSSRDGFSWGEVARTTTTLYSGFEPTGDEPPLTGLMAAHCSDRLQDANGNNVQDGVYHYSKAPGENGKELFIYPDNVPAIRYAGGGGVDANPATIITIEITEGETTTIKTVTPPIPFYALAYVNGTIVAVGGPFGSGGDVPPSQFAVSADMGNTWTSGTYGESGSPTLTVSGAKLKDLQ